MLGMRFAPLRGGGGGGGGGGSLFACPIVEHVCSNSGRFSCWLLSIAHENAGCAEAAGSAEGFRRSRFEDCRI